jgi:hypothetical protein
MRTIIRAGDTGGLDRARVREAVIRLRDQKRAAAAHSRYPTYSGTGLVAREQPHVPYGQSRVAPAESEEEGEGS